MSYDEYLVQLFNRSWAAQRKQLRKNPEPCMICNEPNTEIAIGYLWLCREHRDEYRKMLPMYSTEQKLSLIGVEPPTRQAFQNGDVAVKKVKPKKIRFITDYKTSIWNYRL